MNAPPAPLPSPAERLRQNAQRLGLGLYASQQDRQRDVDVLLAHANGARQALQWVARQCDDALLLDLLAAETDFIDEACRHLVPNQETHHDPGN